MPLSPTAPKKDQIELLNHLEATLGLLVSFAFGDEDALAKLEAMMSRAVANSDIGKTGATQPITFAIEPAKPASNVLTMPSPFPATQALPPDPGPYADFKCKCPWAVKDKDSATHLCLLCGMNAYESHYVFSHTDAGKLLLSGEKEVVIDDWNGPAGEVDAAVFIAPPTEFQPTTEEEFYPDGEESE